MNATSNDNVNVDGRGNVARCGENTMENKIVKTAKPGRVARKRSTTTTTTTTTTAVTVPKTWADVIAMARTITADTFADTLTAVNRDHGVTHGARNVSRFDGRRIELVQNATMRDNATWQLDDVQLLFAWAVAFPMASGKLFDVNRATNPAEFKTAIMTGTAIVNGVRSHWNRNGHNDPTWKPGTPAAVRYGSRRPVFATVTA